MEQNESPIVIERLLAAPATKVWKALTDREQMKAWYFNLDAFEAVVGFEFSFPGQGHKGEQYMHLCRITEVIPEKKLVYSWSYENFGGMSYVSFELFPEGEHTRLVLTHTGVHTFPASNSDFEKGSFVEGWTMLIGTMLPGYLAKG